MKALPVALLQRVVMLFLLLLAASAQAAPKSEYWAFWDKSNPESIATINHEPWQQLLDLYLVSRPAGSLFRYQAVTAADRQKLKRYLQSLASIDPRNYARAEQKAYWINFYNALTVDLVLENYPIKSITKIGPWYQFGPWEMEVATVATQALTLNDIEHRILRPLWRDNRIHYAVNCASIGCPDLSAVAFTGANTDDMLDRLAKRFIRQEKGVSWIGRKLTISRIYEWYESDFINQEGVVLHLRRYSTQGQSKRLKNYSGLLQYRYDWRLNDLK